MAQSRTVAAASMAGIAVKLAVSHAAMAGIYIGTWRLVAAWLVLPWSKACSNGGITLRSGT